MQTHVIPVLTEGQAKDYRDLLLDMDWQEGKARTKELTGTIKKNTEIKPTESAEAKKISGELCNIVSRNREFMVATQMKQMMAFKFNNYAEPGGAYDRHTDAPWMGSVRTDFTMVLALTDPSEYEGGDHHVVSPLEGEKIFRPNAGEMVLYETGYPHWVDPVYEGSRISALSWCESRMPNERHRACTATLLNLSRELEARMHDAQCTKEQADDFRKWFVDVGSVHSAIQREWSTV